MPNSDAFSLVHDFLIEFPIAMLMLLLAKRPCATLKLFSHFWVLLHGLLQLMGLHPWKWTTHWVEALQAIHRPFFAPCHDHLMARRCILSCCKHLLQVTSLQTTNNKEQSSSSSTLLDIPNKFPNPSKYCWISVRGTRSWLPHAWPHIRHPTSASCSCSGSDIRPKGTSCPCHPIAWDFCCGPSAHTTTQCLLQVQYIQYITHQIVFHESQIKDCVTFQPEHW